MDLNDQFDLNEIEFTREHFPKVFSILHYFILSEFRKCKLQNRETELVHPKWIRSFMKASIILPLPPFSLIRDFGKKTPEGTSPNFPSVVCVIDRSDQFIFFLMDTHLIRTSITRALWLPSQSFVQFSKLSKALKFLKDIFNSDFL